MATSELPDDMLIEIFSRLPAKSVGKCRCLAKQWRTLLSTPQFIKSHLSRKTHQESLLLITPSQSFRSIDAIKDGGVSRKLELTNNWIQAVGSCDGLVLLRNEDDEMFLMNPITVQQVRIPDPPLAFNRKKSMHGFGYDSIGDDYKIVTLSYKCDADIEGDSRSIGTSVDVYSVKRGVWKRAGVSPYKHSIHRLFSGAFVNGAIHWSARFRRTEASGYSPLIAAFDLSREVFGEIPTPNGFDVANNVFFSLVVLGGFLCMVDVQTDIRTDLWIMEEYGVVESWTKFITDAPRFPEWDRDIVIPLCFLGEEEVVMAVERLVVCNMEANTMRAMIVDGLQARLRGVCTFVGSLISPAFIGFTEESTTIG